VRLKKAAEQFWQEPCGRVTFELLGYRVGRLPLVVTIYHLNGISADSGSSGEAGVKQTFRLRFST
jgi:hypothetical protein